MSESVRPAVAVFTGGVFSQNGYVLSCPETGEGIFVDPGAAVADMLRHAREANVRIKGIILTHAHIDHVDGVAAAKAATGAPIRLHRADESLYQQAPLQAQWFGLKLDPLPPLDGYLEEGTPVTFGKCSLDVTHTPGHAPGHVILTSPGICVVGDCVFLGSIGRTDLPGGDLATLMSSIRESILTLPDETALYPGHGPATTVRHERLANPFLTPQLGGSRFA
jgi:hydroxyacylglutathione hydrolase